MWKKSIDSCDFFYTMHSFEFFLNKILVFIRNASQVAILKIEHYKFFIWQLNNIFTMPCCLYFERLIRLRKICIFFNFIFLMSTDGEQNFRIEKKTTGNYGRLNKLPNAANRNVLAPKL